MNRRIFIRRACLESSLLGLAGFLAACGYDESPKVKKARGPLGSKSSPSADATETKAPTRPSVEPPKPPDDNTKEATTEVRPEPTSNPTEETEIEYFDYYPLYAMATYFDGTTGPVTAEIDAATVSGGEDSSMIFWHGHGGMKHSFVLSADDKLRVLNGERVEIETSRVSGHSHRLFIDPTDEKWRIPGQQMVKIAKPGELK